MEMRLEISKWKLAKALVKSTNFSLTAKINYLEICVKASTVKIVFRNVFGNTLDFVREL